MTPMPNPFIDESERSSLAPVRAAGALSPSAPAATDLVSIDGAAASPPEMAPEWTPEPPSFGTAATPTVSPAADVVADNSQSDIAELIYFSEYAAERCKDIISPPRRQEEIDRIGLGIVAAAFNLHPRDLDFDPPPLFLRKPSTAFMEALFECGEVKP